MDIQEFYRDVSVFVTGATGFLGRVLVEKLLRSCPELRTIYILVRPKKAVDVTDRFQDYLNHEVFQTIREQWPDRMSKIRRVAGNLTDASLGISVADQEELKRQVQVVFHAAATVKLDEELQCAGQLNALGTKRVMDLCQSLTRLKSMVYVSTAYCIPLINQQFQERIYELDESIALNHFMATLLSEDSQTKRETLERLTAAIKKIFKNTYLYTKAVAEHLVLAGEGQFPISIVRPSIITSALAEPKPGWVEGLHGATAFITEGSRGMITSYLAEPDNICDFIPVDIVANTLIVAAHFDSQRYYQNADKSSKIYHCVSGEDNPITIRELMALVMKWSRIYPSKYVVMYPNIYCHTQQWLHGCLYLTTHLLPSWMLDRFVKKKAGRPSLVKIAKMVEIGAATVRFVMFRPFHFDTTNMRQLVKATKRSGFNHDFNCDIAPMSWNVYFKVLLQGIRRYILRDSDDTIPAAVKTVKKLYWMRQAFYWGVTSLVVIYILQIIFMHNQLN